MVKSDGNSYVLNSTTHKQEKQSRRIRNGREYVTPSILPTFKENVGGSPGDNIGTLFRTVLFSVNF